MGYNSKVLLNAREQLDRFLGIFYPRFSIPKMKFLRQMLYGIQATKSVILNRIAANIAKNAPEYRPRYMLRYNGGGGNFGKI